MTKEKAQYSLFGELIDELWYMTWGEDVSDDEKTDAFAAVTNDDSETTDKGTLSLDSIETDFAVSKNDKKSGDQYRRNTESGRGRDNSREQPPPPPEGFEYVLRPKEPYVFHDVDKTRRSERKGRFKRSDRNKEVRFMMASGVEPTDEALHESRKEKQRQSRLKNDYGLRKSYGDEIPSGSDTCFAEKDNRIKYPRENGWMGHSSTSKSINRSQMFGTKSSRREEERDPRSSRNRPFSDERERCRGRDYKAGCHSCPVCQRVDQSRFREIMDSGRSRASKSKKKDIWFGFR